MRKKLSSTAGSLLDHLICKSSRTYGQKTICQKSYVQDMDTVARYLAGYDAAIMFLRYHAKEKHGFILRVTLSMLFFDLSVILFV